jgi:glutaredoxin
MQAQVLGLSVDSIPSLKAWSESMGGIGYPLLSDFYPHGQVARMYGVLRANGIAERAIFIIDKKGVIVYVDVHDISQQPDNEVLFAELARINGMVNAQAAPQPVITPAAEPDADVVMYCTPWCADCRKAREYLNLRNIPYVEVDITRDLAGAQRMRGWTGGKQITPTFNIRGTIIIDFDKTRLVEVLGIKE